MGRPPRGIGEHGPVYFSRISKDGVTPETWRAYCGYRGKDGKTYSPERRGTGKDTEKAQAAAQANLLRHIRELNGSNTTQLARASRLREAIAKYLESVKKRRKATTYDEYRKWANARLIPDLGELRLSECTAGRLQDYFDDLAETPSARTGAPLAANSRRGIRKVLRGALQVAIRDGALTVNPVDHLEEIEGDTKPPGGYDGETAAKFFDAIDTDEIAVAYGHNELIKFQFHTGARIGEATALRWQDLNLTDKPIAVTHPKFGRVTIPPRTIWFNGNIVRVTGAGLVRHDGKTPSSVDFVEMTPSLHTMLTVRRPADARPEDPIFPNSKGAFRCPHSTQTNIRRLRKRVKFPDFTTHFGRRTYGTGLDAGGQSARKVADGLRKASIADTQKSYMLRGLKNPEASGIIEGYYKR